LAVWVGNTSYLPDGTILLWSTMKSINTVLLTLVSCPILFACGIMPKHYVEPAEGDTATMEFVVDTSSKAGLVFYSDYEVCSDRRVYGSLGTNETNTVTVPADKPLAFTMNVGQNARNQKVAIGAGLGGVAGAALMGSGMRKGCAPTLEFAPEPGRHYRVNLQGNGQECTYNVVEVLSGNSDGEHKPIALKERATVVPFDESGPFCE